MNSELITSQNFDAAMESTRHKTECISLDYKNTKKREKKDGAMSPSGF